MLAHDCGRIFLKLPFRYPAVRTHPKMQLVAKPACRPAMFGIIDNKASVAMGDNLRRISPSGHGFDPMQSAAAGWPKFDFFHQIKKINVFSVIPFLFLRSLGHSSHLLCLLSIKEALCRR